MVAGGALKFVKAKVAAVTTPLTVALNVVRSRGVAFAVNVGAVATPLGFVLMLAVRAPPREGATRA